MSTIFVFKADTPTRATAPIGADSMLLHNSVTGRVENVPVSLALEGGRTVTAGTTSQAFAASGINTLSTLASVTTLTDPTYVGAKVMFIFPSSTAIQTIAPVAATILGSTVTPTGATKITHAGTSDALSGSITLESRTTAQWAIQAVVGGYTTLGAPLTITTT